MVNFLLMSHQFYVCVSFVNLSAVRQYVCQSVRQYVCQSVRKSNSWFSRKPSTRQSVSQSGPQSVSQLDSQSDCQTISQSDKQSGLLLGVENTVDVIQQRTEGQKDEENNKNNRFVRRCSIVTCPVSSTPRRSYVQPVTQPRNQLKKEFFLLLFFLHIIFIALIPTITY